MIDAYFENSILKSALRIEFLDNIHLKIFQTINIILF